MKYKYVIPILLILCGLIYFFLKYSIRLTPTDTEADLSSASASPSPSGNKYCSRTSPYKTSPEFERGVSLFYQRLEENPKAPYVSDQEKQTMQVAMQIRNCLNIQFEKIENENTEGYFLFDSNSSLDSLNIFVDNRYKKYDDALTALLLSHEITHAAQLAEFKQDNVDLTCVEKEVNAIKMELQLIRFFNNEEQQSLSSRVNSEKNRAETASVGLLPKLKNNPAYSDIKFLFSVNKNVGPKCTTPDRGDFEEWMKNDEQCHYREMNKYLTKAIESDPFYREQCELN